MRRRVSKPADSSPALRRLGLAAPPPFVGRARELGALSAALSDAEVLVVHGAVGAGKTRLARQLMTRSELLTAPAAAAAPGHVLAPAYVRCEPGDAAVAISCRAERAFDILPGSLFEALRDEPRLLLVDDVHNLAEDDAARLLSELLPRRGLGRVLLLTRDVLPLPRSDVRRFEMELGGLDHAAAREMWSHLEETYGPTPQGACDEAIARTRALPLALRREYACESYGDDAWEVEALAPGSRAALEAVAVVRLPAAPAAVAALEPEIGVEEALIDLVTRQLVDPLLEGRFAIHDVVRDRVLAAMSRERRRELELRAAQLVSSIGRGQGPRRMAWEAGDDGALGTVDPVERMREAAHHLIAAGEGRAALERLRSDRDLAARRGRGAEVLGVVDALEGEPTAASMRGALAALRAEVAARHGRVAEALEALASARVAGGDRDAAMSEVERASLLYRAGDIRSACELLGALMQSNDVELRGRAVALLAEIEIDRGNIDRAQMLAAATFDRDRADLSDATRAILHVALASAEDRAGQVSQARASLSRAASSVRRLPGVGAQIEARRAMCLVREGRLSEAERALSDAQAAACEADEVMVADDIRRCRALVATRRGDTGAAVRTLRELVSRRRERGDEIGALRAEIDLAVVLERRGELAAAAELASACSASAARRGLHGLAAEAALVSASIDIAELRLHDARAQLGALLDSPYAGLSVREQVHSLMALVDAWSGDVTVADAMARVTTRDEIDRHRLEAEIAAALGDTTTALEAARRVAVRSERAGRRVDMAEALALVARLQLSRGDKPSAAAAAARAVREARSAGLAAAAANALFVLAALARDEGEVDQAEAHAREAEKVATAAGLPVQRLVAAYALEAILHGETEQLGSLRSAAAATMSQAAQDAASRMLADLGLTAARPFRVVTSAGQETFVSDASAGLLRLAERSLAIDGVREVIVRQGVQIADLRRRSLLKRLLFLFASMPGNTFSKEEIVQSVWNVEYHPLRHDAALFTNIMRIRRLLGKDGADLIRVSDAGYRFTPPKDFVFVEAVGAGE